MIDNDATQTGVSADDAAAQLDQQIDADKDVSADENKDRPKSQRELGMEMMEARRKESLAAEGIDIDSTDQTAAQTEDKTDDAATQLAAQTDDNVFAGDFTKTKVKIKIDGQEQLVPLSDVMAKYQKGGAADKRLEEATRLLEEARVEREKAAGPAAKQAAEDKVQAASVDVEALAAKRKELLDGMYSGADEAQTEKLFQEVIDESVAAALKGRGNATLDDQAVIARVVPAIQQKLEVERALKQFQKDFRSIATDPHLATKADQFLNEALADGKSYDDAFKFAGESTQDWLREVTGVKSPGAVETTRNDRAAKKEGIDNLPSASARTTVPAAASPQTNSSVIADMRKNRLPG